MNDLLAKMKTGNRRALARLLTKIENDPQAAQEIMATIYTQTGQAHLVGFTGSPGSGKSSLVTEVAKQLRQRQFTVAILAVDPSSPLAAALCWVTGSEWRRFQGIKGFLFAAWPRGAAWAVWQSHGQRCQTVGCGRFRPHLD